MAPLQTVRRRAETSVAREGFAKHLAKRYSEGEKDEHRLTWKD
jgi:hypothetical protein